MKHFGHHVYPAQPAVTEGSSRVRRGPGEASSPSRQGPSGLHTAAFEGTRPCRRPLTGQRRRPDMAAAAGAGAAPSGGLAPGQQGQAGAPGPPRGSAPLGEAQPRQARRHPKVWSAGMAPTQSLPPSPAAPRPQGAVRRAGRGGAAGALYPAGSRRNFGVAAGAAVPEVDERRRRGDSGGRERAAAEGARWWRPGAAVAPHLPGRAEPRSSSPAAWSARRRPAPWARG